jgi:glycerol-3-phosphate O-acyltransferase
VLSASELESLCHLTAQRLSLLYAPAAPEFFDKTLFRGFIANMREQKLIWLAENGKLAFDTRLNDWEQDARLVLNRELRHTIHKISPDAANPPAAPPQSGV